MRNPLLLPLTVALLSACGSSADSGWRTVAEAELTDPQRAQLDAARDATSALFQGLLGRLMESRKEAGTAASISVCSEIAPRLARDIGAERGLAIGRTSTRLRNPANTPPEWAAALIEDLASPKDPVSVTHADGRLGALLPIFVMQPCLACHGPTDDIEPDVRDALAKHYPQDRATGFAQNDLRGWFWVEVPAAKD